MYKMRTIVDKDDNVKQKELDKIIQTYGYCKTNIKQ